MALIKSISNMQRMKRSVKLRDSSMSDDEMVEIMEKMINTALVAQASGNKGMMKRSVDELRQVRKDVRTGNVKMSSNKQKTIVGRFSTLVDQLEGEQAATKDEKSGGGGLGGIMGSLPSAETLISAVMTANPLLGYSAKIIKDIGGSVKNKSQADKDAAQRQADILQQQKDYVLDRKAELEIESDINDKQLNQLTDYDIILNNIESELIKLRQIWEGDDTELVKESQDTNNNLSKLVEAENRIIEEQRLQREQNEFDKMEQDRERDSGGGVLGGPSGGGEDEEGSGGILGGLAAMLGGKVMTGLMGIFGIFKSIGTVGMTLLRVGARGAIIGTVIMAIYDFINGFFGAGDILDMDEADLNIGDRIIAGFASVWGNIIKLFDTVLNWFGIDIIDSEGITKKIAKGTKELVDGFFEWVFGLFDNVKNFIKDFDIGETLTLIKDKSIEFMQNLVNIIPDMVNDAFAKVGDMLGDAKNWIFGDDDEEDKPKVELTPIDKGLAPLDKGLKPLGGEPERMSFDGSSASKNMPEKMSKLEDASYQDKSGSGSHAIVTGNNNKTINNNKTEVQTIKNTSNLDESIRGSNLATLDRLRVS